MRSAWSTALGLSVLILASMFALFEFRTRVALSVANVLDDVLGDEFHADVARFAVLHAPVSDACLIETRLRELRTEVEALGYLQGIVAKREKKFDHIPLRLWIETRGVSPAWKERRMLQTAASIYMPDNELLSIPPALWTDDQLQELRIAMAELWPRLGVRDCEPETAISLPFGR